MTPGANEQGLMSVRDALAGARSLGIDRLDAQRLLADLLSCPRSRLLTHSDATLNEAQRGEWHERLARLAAGEPLAYVLGWQEFFGLRLSVSPSVLVPRSATETLVEWANELLGNALASSSIRVVDLGTGSGAIALALKHFNRLAVVFGTDAAAPALAVARRNGERLGLSVAWRCGDWWSAVDSSTRFDLAVSNPPYIAEGDAHLDELKHEPRTALTAGSGGLEALRCVIEPAPAHLRPGAWLLLEHGWNQATAVRGMLREAGFGEISTRRDLGGRERCSGGRLTG